MQKTSTIGVGTAPSSQALGDRIDLIASRSATILIEGETGVGKAVAARQIHARSRRKVILHGLEHLARIWPR